METVIGVRLYEKNKSVKFEKTKEDILRLLERNKDGNFQFLLKDENGEKIENFGPMFKNEKLIEKELNILDGDYGINFYKNGQLETFKNKSKIFESLPRDKSIEQLKRVRKISKGVDIADRISDTEMNGANLQFNRNVIDSGIQSYEDFIDNNTNFISGWNTKHLVSPFKNNKK